MYFLIVGVVAVNARPSHEGAWNRRKNQEKFLIFCSPWICVWILILKNSAEKYNLSWLLNILLLFSHQVVSNSFLIPCRVVSQAPLSMGFLRQEYCSGLSFPFPLQEIFLTQGQNICLLHWQVGSLPLSHQVSPLNVLMSLKCWFQNEWDHG